MSTTLPPGKRHALGLPAGSIRAVLAIMVAGLVCILILLPVPAPPAEPTPIPPYLIYLLFMILGHYYAAHGNSIAPGDAPSPLYLPRGSIRILLVVGLSLAVNYKMFNDYEGLRRQLVASLDAIKDQPFLSFALLAAFFVGVIFRWLLGGATPSRVFRDVEAWVALIAVVLLGVDYLIRLVINPSLSSPLKMPDWEWILASVIAFYFGARS
jgi:hypothetical protein